MIKSNIELYAPIKGFDCFYEVSTWGNVRSLDVFVNNLLSKNKKILKKGKILKASTTKCGYLRVTLSKNNIQKTFSVHRLVAETFIPNPNNYPQVNHKDEDKTNNFRINLEWCTAKYNINYGTHNERLSKIMVNREDCSKKVYQYDLKGNLIKEWVSAAEADRNGYNDQAISKCCLGKHKTHKGYIWSYIPIEDFDINNYLPKRKNNKSSKKVYQYDKDYNLINIWVSASEAGRNGFNSANIIRCCNKHLKTYKDYIWSYSEIN